MRWMVAGIAASYGAALFLGYRLAGLRRRDPEAEERYTEEVELERRAEALEREERGSAPESRECYDGMHQACRDGCLCWCH